MCGRYVIITDEQHAEMLKMVQEIERTQNVQVKTGEIYPTDLAPVLVPGDGVFVPRAMNWGFPYPGEKRTVFNTRADHSLSKFWKHATLNNRCIVPASGYYEWALEQGHEKKTKFLFTMPNQPTLYMGGIYQEIKGVEHFSIMTTEPNDDTKQFHTRMPVVLHPSELEQWVRPGTDFELLFNRQGIKVDHCVAPAVPSSKENA